MAMKEETEAKKKRAELKASLVQKYGPELIGSDTPKGFFVFQKPSAVAFERYEQGMFRAVTSDKRGNQSLGPHNAQLARDCLVYPRTPEDQPDINALGLMFEAYPAQAAKLAAELQGLAGGGEDSVGKL